MRSISLFHINRVGLSQWKAREWWCRQSVMIWSQEHRAWWRPQALGYTNLKREAWVVNFPTAYDQTKHCSPEKKISYYTAPFSKIPPMENPPEEGTPAGATSSPTAPAPDPARLSPAATRDVAQDGDFGD